VRDGPGAAHEHFEDVCAQVRQMMVRKVSSEIIDPDQRVDAILSICIDAIAMTSSSDEVFRAVVDRIAERRDEEPMSR
jgi:hypothetical protein